ncbi:MAG: exodeoxyribonuclease VII large subunit [Bacteroidetes bacterium]|nr:exodeoxyribonuclease VII large subunit [Bacteroidota bacterium]
MPEQVDNKQVFTLTEVANSIRKTIADRYASAYWIKAEINKLNVYAKSGHCFPELVDKRDGKIECEMQATIWKLDFDRINRAFKAAINEPLKDGIKVLLLATISYEPKYGLSLIIRDIDPSFSLGELEREKKETIERLQKEKLFGKNKLVSLALLPKRIAVISVETSKGYQDFIKVIDQNIFGYRFFHMLFPAVLQGDASIKTIRSQLSRIKKVKGHFDAVAIIRGGGADVGLSSFNNYQLAKAICNFPLPVFTGIGHSTNLTVTEMVAFQSAITPTELGDFFLQKFHNFAVPVQRAEELLLQDTMQLVEIEKRHFDHTTRLFKNLVKNRLRELNQEIYQLTRGVLTGTRLRLQTEHESLQQTRYALARESRELIGEQQRELKRSFTNLQKDTGRLLKTQDEQLKHTAKIIKLVDPMNVVQRGYSITSVNGKLVRSVDQLAAGDILETLILDGTIESKVEVTKKNKK